MARRSDSLAFSSTKLDEHMSRAPVASDTHLHFEATEERKDSPTSDTWSAAAVHLPRANKVSSNGTPPPICHILRLSNEALLMILDQLDDDPSKAVRFDSRAHLSVESFGMPLPVSLTGTDDLKNWRRTCRRFSVIGAEHQFSEVTTRFTVKDFDRLENIASRPHLAQVVRKFTYIIPYFYVNGSRDRIREILPSLTASRGKLNVGVYLDKIDQQNSILNTQKDQTTLLKALSAFTKLQHVKILPLMDRLDEELLKWARWNHQIAEQLELTWQTACSHSTTTVGDALIKSGSPCTRFSSPRLNPQSAIFLAKPGTFALLISRLKCIELHFDDASENMDDKMRELSPMLRAVFEKSAHGLEAVHVGFPSIRPISLRLKEIFSVEWRRLACFGIQGWKLEGDEIIELAKRQRHTLTGLRLRDVLLKPGSRWKDVLPKLKEIDRLNWCSLRRIGYAETFEEQNQGVEIPDDPEDGLEDVLSDSEDDFSNGLSDHHSDASSDNLETGIHTPGSTHADGEDAEEGPMNGTASSMDGYESDAASYVESVTSNNSDDERGIIAANAMEFPPHEPYEPSSTDVARLWCNCHDHYLDLENAGPYSDNGIEIGHKTRKVWEKWVIGRCPIHSPDEVRKGR